MLPEKQQQAFQQSAKEAITALRRAVNTGQPMERPTPQRESQPQAGPERPRQSVKVQLRQIKEGQTAARATPHKVHIRPQQKGR